MYQASSQQMITPRLHLRLGFGLDSCSIPVPGQQLFPHSILLGPRSPHPFSGGSPSCLLVPLSPLLWLSGITCSACPCSTLPCRPFSFPVHQCAQSPVSTGSHLQTACVPVYVTLPHSPIHNQSSELTAACHIL